MLALHIDSFGGEFSCAGKIYKTLVNLYHDDGIETVAVGYRHVYSAALLIYIACIFRIAYNDTKFLLHRCRTTNPLAEKHKRVSEENYFSAIASNSNITMPEIIELADNNTLLTYQTALSKGIVNFDYKITSIRYK